MTFTMYSTKWCGYCQRLKRDLKDIGIEFEEVDIELVPEAADLVGAAN
ncbi:MAG: NrdH-redoxin, partial [Ilumatobacteraceae bacterium]|nr:NrdH-redoxin [Ilumatobacteraceae bacterium]